MNSHWSKVLKTSVLQDVTIVVAPSSNPSVEHVNQPVLLRMSIVCEGLRQLGSLAHDGRLTGLNKGFEAQTMISVVSTRARFPNGILSDVKTKEIKTRLAVACLERVG